MADRPRYSICSNRSHLASVAMRPNNNSTIQTSPIHGGRRPACRLNKQVHSLALPAFLASAVSTLDLQLQILPTLTCTTDTHIDSYSTHGLPSPLDHLPHKQSIWDKAGILSFRAVVESSISDPHQMTRFLAAIAPRSETSFGSHGLFLWAEAC